VSNNTWGERLKERQKNDSATSTGQFGKRTSQNLKKRQIEQKGRKQIRIHVKETNGRAGKGGESRQR